MTKPVTGRCFCGAVRFEFDHPPVTTRACWCRDCQYLSSGIASINAIFRRKGFRLTGEVREYASLADSGIMMRRRFCGACGTPLFSEAADTPDFMVVRAGALDNPEISCPASVIWTASAPSWRMLTPGLPSSKGQVPAVPV